MKNNIRYIGLVVFALLLNSEIIHAQNINDIPKASLSRSKIKIDGKADDWASPLKEFNKSTGLSYTITNDDNKLYIIMQASEINTTRKLLLGGITFSLNADGRKKSEELASLTYPVITTGSRRAAMGGGGQRTFGSYQTMTQEQRDSMQNAMGQKQLESAKDIKVFGFKTVTDTLISIYNEYSIKAAATLDTKGTYTYEISIPLELLPLNLAKEFGFNVKVNGLQTNGFGGGRSFGGNRPGGGGGGGGRGGFDFQDLVTPTDFWGKYTLTK